MNNDPKAALRLFSDYLKVTGVAHTGPEPAGAPGLIGKRLGLINGSSWITLWSNFFGKMYLPGVHLINAGNEAVQINFMEAFSAGLPTPPNANISAFQRYARDLVELARVDAVVITCSTMNQAHTRVQEALKPMGVPVFQIDRPMMERAVDLQTPVGVIATHGPTVESTQALLREVAQERGLDIAMHGSIVEGAWHLLAAGDVEGHNQSLADAIRKLLSQKDVGCVVLAQLSMTVFLLSFPEPEAAFGVPVLTSGQCGFEYLRRVLENMENRPAEQS